MGKRSMVVFAACWLCILAPLMPAAWAEDCELFFEDFSGLSSHSWSYFDGNWAEQSGALSVSQIETGRLAAAETSFWVDELYRIDVDLEVVASGVNGGFGIYTFTTGDSFLEVGGRTADGIAAMVYPGDGIASLMVWDVVQGEWFDSNIVSATEPITSVGFSLSDNQAVLRLNKQNTAAVFSGDFSFAPWVVNTLWLMAQGTGAQVRFDNVCAEAPGSAPPPTGAYDGIWKDAGETMNFYIQTYVTGSALVIATPDLQTFYVFLVPDFSNGIDAGDMAGGGHHLTLNLSSLEQASATLTPSGSAAQTYAISKFFGLPSVTTHDGIWKSPSCQAGTTNYYVQSYNTGAGIVIATTDLSKLYVFLDSDLSDGVDVADLAGTGAHLTLSLSEGQTDTMARCFAAPHTAAGGSPAASCSLTGTGSHGSGVINGPGGSSIQLPDETVPGVTVTIASADTSEVVEPGETSVSQAVKISTGGAQEPFSGKGFFKVSLPVSGDISDPTLLTMKTKLSTGLVLPVHGEYDATAKTYTADVAGLYDGWVFGVVIQPNQLFYPDTGGMAPAAWQTELDWKTFAWHVVDSSGSLSEVHVREIQSAAKAASQALSNALFRAPKLWITTKPDPDIPPGARLIHNVAGKIKFAQPGNEEDANYSLVSKTEAEMLALGRMYLDYDAIKTQLTSKGIHLKNVVIHELFHAVQAGYDIRRGWDNTTHSLKPYYEGTATPLGQSYQAGNGSITGSSAVVRDIAGSCQEARLNRAVDDYTKRGECGDYYSKQDFFTYVTRMYNNNDWSFLSSLFQELHTVTLNQFGRSMAEYRKLYRTALNSWITFWTSKSLPEVYFDYALDRAYKHSPDASLRDSDSAFKPNTLADSLFSVSGGDWVDKDKKKSDLDPIEPLSTKYVGVLVPEELKTESDSTLSLFFSIEGAKLASDQVRIVIFRENEDEVMVASEGEIEVTDITKPVTVTVNKDVPNLKILIMNGSVEDKTATVTVSMEDRRLIYEFHLVLQTSDLDHCHENMILVASYCFDQHSYGCERRLPLEWNGNRFSATAGWDGHTEVTIEGEIAGDESSLISFYYETFPWIGMPQSSFLPKQKIWAENLPLVSRSGAGLVYQVTGAQVSEHVRAEAEDDRILGCTSTTLIADESSLLRITVPR